MRFAASARRSGFTALEALVVVAIVAIVAAVVVPVALARYNDTDSQTAAGQINAISAAVENFHEQVGTFPGAWDDLFAAPTTSNKDACGKLYTADEVGAWGGPYLNAPNAVAATGPDSRTWSGFKTKVISGGPQREFQFWLQGPASTAAGDLDYKLDSLFDFDGNLSAGYITRNDLQGRLFFNMQIGGCGGSKIP